MENKYTVKQHIAKQVAEYATKEIRKWNNDNDLYEQDCEEFVDLFRVALLKDNGYEDNQEE